MEFGKVRKVLRPKEKKRKVDQTKTRVPRGYLPTTLSEPSDSILSSPEYLSEFRCLETDSISEFVFGDIEDEFSNEQFESSKAMNNIDQKCEVVSSDKMSKRSSRSSTSSRSSNVDNAESSANSRKRPNNNSKSRDGSTGSLSKRARSRGADESKGAQRKDEKTMCTKCKEYFDPSEFRRHARNEHNFPCDQENCDYFLETSLALINHKKKIHMIEPSNSYSSNWTVICEACGKSISHKKDAHLTTLHPFPCDVLGANLEVPCSKRFLTEIELERHIKNSHKGATLRSKRGDAQVQVIAVVPKIKKEVCQSLPVVRTPRVSKRESSPELTNESSSTIITETQEVHTVDTLPLDPKDQPLTVSKKRKAKTSVSSSTFYKPLAIRPDSPMNDESYWVCSVCEEFFPTLEKYTEHVDSVKAHKVPCRSEGCAMKLSSQADMFKHMHYAHGSNTQVKHCSLCKEVVDAKSYAGHIKRVHGSKCGWESCGACFLQNKNLWQHMIKKHGWGKRMNPDDVTNQDIKEVLVESEDEDIMELDGKKCDVDIEEIENDVLREEGAKSRGSLASLEIIEQEIEADGEKVIRCQVCELLFTRAKIVAHGKKVHKFKCTEPECKLAFTQEFMMQRHRYVDHEILEAKEEYLVCPECLEFFPQDQKYTFDIHVKKGIHLTCFKCDKKFQKYDNHLHKFHCDFEHNVVNDIKCGICDMEFTSKDTKLVEIHRQLPHIYGPCPYCEESSNKLVKFVTEERYSKHQADCDCKDRTAEVLDDEDAYDLTEQITDESFVDEDSLFDVKDVKGTTEEKVTLNVANKKTSNFEEEDFHERESKASRVVDTTKTVVREVELIDIKSEERKVGNKTIKLENVGQEVKLPMVVNNETSAGIQSNAVDENENSEVDDILLNEDVSNADVIIEEVSFDEFENLNDYKKSTKDVENTSDIKVINECKSELLVTASIDTGNASLHDPNNSAAIVIPGVASRADDNVEMHKYDEDFVVIEAESNDENNDVEEGDDFHRSNVEHDGLLERKVYMMDIQDSSISTTGIIETAFESEASVDELIDSDPEVSSSVIEHRISNQDEQEDDVMVSNTEEEENLLGISQQGIHEIEEQANVSEEVVNLVSNVTEEPKVSPVNLVPYMDTDSDCDSLEEKNAAAGKVATNSLCYGKISAPSPDIKFDAPEVDSLSAVNYNKKVDAPKKGHVLITRKDGQVTVTRSDFATDQPEPSKKSPQSSAFINIAVPKRVKKSNSCDAQLMFLEHDIKSIQHDEIEVDNYIKTLGVKPIKMEIDDNEPPSEVKFSEHSVSVSTEESNLCNSTSFSSILLDAELSPSKEEVQRALLKIRRKSGEKNSLGVSEYQQEHMIGNFGKSAAKSQRGSFDEELLNFETQIRKKEVEYSFPNDASKAEHEVGSYQSLSLLRPGKPGRKKPCKSALSHETEETQMQADMARQQQEKRNNRNKHNMTGKISTAGGSALSGQAFPASVIKAIPRPSKALSLQPVLKPTNLLKATAPPPVSVLLASLTQQPMVVPQTSQLQQQSCSHPTMGTPALSSERQVNVLRQIVPQVPTQFVTIPQPSKRPPTMQTIGALMPDPTECSSQVSPAESDMLSIRSKEESHRTYGRARRSTDIFDHSYVMDMDYENFDLSEKLDKMEEEFDRSEAEGYPSTETEESVENIKNLLDSQVASQTSFSTPSKSKSTTSTSSSDIDELGLFSPGDNEPRGSSSVNLMSDNSPFDNSAASMHSNTTPEKKFEHKEEKISPLKQSQDEGYDDDIDDLLGDSDSDDDEPTAKKESIAPPVKIPVTSEPSRKKPPNFVCPECGQKYGKNEAQYNNHIRQQHNFPCKYCPLKFTYVNGLEEHLNSVHIHETEEANSAGFTCNICNKSFKRQGPYLKHKKRDHNIPCIECGMSFTNEPFLEEHMATMHGINSPPSGKAIEARKPSSPVEVKFQLANGLINDSPPKKSKPREDFVLSDGNKTEVVKKSLKLSVPKDSSRKSKNSKAMFKKIADISFLSEDDTICEKCGQKFEELEAFEHHIELPHEHQCGMNNCELSFVFQYYLDLHIYEEHKTGIKPDERDRPIEESVPVSSSTRNDSYSSMEDQISLADLAVSEDYLPGIGPKSVIGGLDAAKMKSLKNYRIPKKSASPVKDESQLSLNNSLNSSWSSYDSPGKQSIECSKPNGSFVCHQCNKIFVDNLTFDQHVSSHYNDGRNILGVGTSKCSFKCHECNIVFHDQPGLDGHVQSHYSPSSSKQNAMDQRQTGSRRGKVKCPLCSQYFEEMSNMMEHLKAKHANGKLEKRHDFWCGRCRKVFETEKKFEDHEKIDHKYGCQFCYKAYILEVDLNHHVEKHHSEKSHKVQMKHRKGFTCQLCGVNISQMEMFKIHQSQGHHFSCYHEGCSMRFQHKRELVSHLKNVHNIVQIKIGDDTEDEHRGYLTTERSQANIDIAEWAESWIDSPLAIEHMRKVMRGVVKSRRHDLFLDKREREQCSGSETSRLYQLSNPGFLGGGGEKDTAVITHLRDRVFMEFFDEADPKLRELGIGSAFLYANCVLFPETFIHQHQAQGKSREEAEQAFMEVAVDVEERKALNQEIKEAAVMNRTETEEDSGDEWVDHSDMEDEIDD